MMKYRRLAFLCLALCLLLRPLGMSVAHASPASTTYTPEPLIVQEIIKLESAPPVQTEGADAEPTGEQSAQGAGGSAVASAGEENSLAETASGFPAAQSGNIRRQAVLLLACGALVFAALLILVLITIVKNRRRGRLADEAAQSASVRQSDTALNADALTSITASHGGLRICAAVMSDRGRVRRNNEDNYLLNGAFMAKPDMDKGGFLCEESGDELQLYAVCDGMGGIDAGEDASFAAVSRLCDWLNRVRTRARQVPTVGEEVASISEQIWHDSLAKGIRSGTTVALAMVHGRRIDLLNAGDSRIYQYRKGKLAQLSADQTEVQSLTELGLLTREQAKQHPRRHVLTTYLGMGSAAQLEPHTVSDIALHPGDVYLLCSDGLTDMLDDEHIADVLAGCTAPDGAVHKLVEAALSGGGRDNVTVMVLSASDAQQISEE